jgi:hypothetical protein
VHRSEKGTPNDRGRLACVAYSRDAEQATYAGSSSDPPPSIMNRVRPMLGASVAPEIKAAVRERAQQERRPIGHVMEDLLRAGLKKESHRMSINITANLSEEAMEALRKASSDTGISMSSIVDRLIRDAYVPGSRAEIVTDPPVEERAIQYCGLPFSGGTESTWFDMVDAISLRTADSIRMSFEDDNGQVLFSSLMCRYMGWTMDLVLRVHEGRRVIVYNHDRSCYAILALSRDVTAEECEMLRGLCGACAAPSQFESLPDKRDHVIHRDGVPIDVDSVLHQIAKRRSNGKITEGGEQCPKQ